MIASMGWRDLLMVLLGVGAIPLTIYSAYYGLLAYCGLSFLRPQSMVFSAVVSETRFTFFVGIALIFRAIISPGPRFRLKAPTLVFIMFWLWMLFCTVLSDYQEGSWEFLNKFSKIGIAALLLTGLIHARWQLKWLVIVLAWCAGFYAIKIGGYFLLGYADVTHHGGPTGMDNNDIALFLAMGFPLLVFGAVEIQNRWGRWLTYFAAAMCIPAVIAGESRGGMLALAASLVITIWRRVGSFKTLVMGAVAVPIILLMIPAETMNRYKSIGDEDDVSIVGRLNAWDVAMRMTDDHAYTGIGMGQAAFMAEYVKYQEDPEDWPHVAHSVWLSALAGMGYPGLTLFILLILVTFWTTWRVRRAARDLGAGGLWAASYSRGVETAVIAFAIAGTFLSQIGFEFVYAVMLLSVPLMAMTQQTVAELDERDDDEELPDGSQPDESDGGQPKLCLTH